MLHSIFIFYP